MMRVRSGLAVAVAALMVVGLGAQEGTKPGAEHAQLKKQVGTWETSMKFGGQVSKGTVTFKMELGGLWLVGDMDSDLGGQRFLGKSLDSYDATKKKFVSVWVDSMSGTPMTMEGTYDAAKKTLTMIGDGPDMTGKLAKWKSVNEYPDDDTINMSMYVGDSKEPMFTIAYKRKK
jgi:hypothetical protein